MALDPYADRARLAVMLAKVVLQNGGTAGRGFDEGVANSGDEEGWGHTLVIVLSTGQVSYHFAPQDVHLLEELPECNVEWDGTFNGRSDEFVKALPCSL